MKNTLRLGLCMGLLIASGIADADRFTKIVEEGGEPTTTSGSYLVNNKRVAVQKELAQRAPTADELGIKLPPRATLVLVETARQIAQYHPTWRIYEYRVEMPRAAFIAHFEQQGLSFDKSANNLKFGNGGEDFIDGLYGDTVSKFRIWRRPQ